MVGPGALTAGDFNPAVEPGPALNKARAGQSVPLKWSLAGNQGLAAMADGYPASQAINCDTHESGSDLEMLQQSVKMHQDQEGGNDETAYLSVDHNA